MNPFEINPNDRWLFAFTHPDDEISILSFIKRLTSKDVSVFCAWSVSNPIRESEAREVMKRLNVPQGNLLFFQFPDKSAHKHLFEMTTSWQDWIQQIKPTKIAMGAFECGHIDHDTTHFVITKSAPEIQKFEIPWYHTYLTRMPVMHRFADSSQESIIQLTNEEWNEKKQLSKFYKSQNIASLLRWYWLAGKLGIKPGFQKVERMRPVIHSNFKTPNLPEKLGKKVMQTKYWKEWIEAINQFENNFLSSDIG